jgi:far upstream element-binding protein
MNHIEINPEAKNAQNELLNRQNDLFGSLLPQARFEASNKARVETIRPSNNPVPAFDPIKSVLERGISGSGGQSIMNTLGDTTKIKRKIYIPTDTDFNYTGLIIGPKGSNQKRLEEQTGCKILVRGRGSQREGQPPQPDDHEDLHVLIVSENESQLARATVEIERILFADEETRTKIKQAQLQQVSQINQGIAITTDDNDPSMTTPYGPPSSEAFVIRVPNDCVGLVIGKKGETIRQLQIESGAKKVQVATDSSREAGFRNLFVEGDREAYEIVQQMVNDIVEQQRRLKQATDYNQGNKEEVPVPNDLVGLVIGRGGETVKSINQRTGAVVFIPKECEPGKSERTFVISGTPEARAQARQEILEKVQEGLRNQQLKALQAQGIPIQLMSSLGYDPNLLQQYLSSFDPQYAAMYQQMYAQQPVVTTVTDSSTLPGSYQNYPQQQQQQGVPNYSGAPDYMNYQNPNGQGQGQGQAQGGYPNPSGANQGFNQQQQQQFYQQNYPQQQ